MPYSRRSRHSLSPSPRKQRSVSGSISRSVSRSPSYCRSPSPYRRGRSVSRSLSMSLSRSRSSSVENPGNNLYVTGLSPRITKRELEKHFSSEGEVVDVHLVMDPWTRESRGFGFVTMSSVKEADRCIKYLDGSVLEGHVITVEKARRRRGRTPTPGRYLGLKTGRGRYTSPSYSPRRRRSHSSLSSGRGKSRSRSCSPRYRGRRYESRSSSPRSRSPYGRGRRYESRSLSPRSRSPYRRCERSYSPCRGRRSYDEYSPYYRRDRSCSLYYRGRSGRSRSYSSSDYGSEEDHYHRRSYRSSYRSHSISLRRRERRSHHRRPSRSRRHYSSSPSRSPPRNCRSDTCRGSSRDRSCSYATSASSLSVSRSVTPGSSS